MPPIDLAAEANALANAFYDFSDAVDDYRFSFDPPLKPADMARLKDESQALQDRAHYFTAQAIGATLKTIQTDLGKIKAVTAQAQQQLKNLINVSKGIKVATSVLSLGTAIAAGNPATILAAAQALEDAIT